MPAERYRVEKYLIADPADVDGDCIDDITELADPVGMNPVNPAGAIALIDGTVAIPDRNILEMLPRNTYDRSEIKFILFALDTAQPGIYFMNTNTHPSHEGFLDVVGLERNQIMNQVMAGGFVHHQNLIAPDGSMGIFALTLSGIGHSFSFMDRVYTMIAASMPLLENNLALYISNFDLPFIQHDLPLYRASRINLVFENDAYGKTDFLALNQAEGYGRLRNLDPDDRPHPRDVVIYEALPNNLPRVAGIITTVPQTPAVACQPARRSRRHTQRLHSRRR